MKDGPTRREYFAAAALTGLLANCETGDADLHDSADEWYEDTADAAKEFADAMVKALDAPLEERGGRSKRKRRTIMVFGLKCAADFETIRNTAEWLKGFEYGKIQRESDDPTGDQRDPRQVGAVAD